MLVLQAFLTIMKIGFLRRQPLRQPFHNVDFHMKPNKPYPDFPLTAHPNGSWCKKILGKIHYFGTWADPQAALNNYLEQRDYLYVGQAPPTTATTIADVLNAFLGYKEVARNEGDISGRTYGEYEAVCDVIAASLGKGRPVEMINGDLLVLRAAFGKGKKGQRVSPVTQKRNLGIARMVFSHANEELDTNIRFKKALCSPKARTLRQRRNENGERLFAAGEIRAIVSAANPQLKAMILLGINCGFGNADCGTVPIETIDLENEWHNYWRPKTQIQRRCPLWDETVAALKKVIGDRESGLVFITKYGGPWWVEETRDPIAHELLKVTKSIGIYRKGVTTFYSLRRTFETIACTARVNQSVIDSIMGHAPHANDMAAIYRQRVFDDSLRECVDHVRAWYLGEFNIG